MIHPSMSREITTTFKRIRHITGFTWKLTPKEIKDDYYQEFQVSIIFKSVICCIIKKCVCNILCFVKGFDFNEFLIFYRKLIPGLTPGSTMFINFGKIGQRKDSLASFQL